MSRNEFVPISGIVERVTPKAIFLRGPGVGARAHWVPRSLIDDGEEIEMQIGVQEILIRQWFVEQEGIEE